MIIIMAKINRASRKELGKISTNSIVNTMIAEPSHIVYFVILRGIF